MESQPVASIAALSSHQLVVLKRGSILTVEDLLLAAPSDIARKSHVALQVVERILDTVCHALVQQPRTLKDVQHEGDEKFTTGDERLDEALGGGFRTGMIWEVVGESAAGKTQLALQLSMMVQLPHRLGGIDGATCYITGTSILPTSRLIDIRETHPLLSPSLCDLADVHTIRASEIPLLLHVLSHRLPTLLDQLLAQPGRKPVKLLVLDALTELFHTHDRVSKDTLFERSRSLTEISHHLHTLASKYQIAVLVLNEVTDVFDRSADADAGRPGEVLYREQSRWFNRADDIPGGSRKEASLGLVWANQVNARIMLSRTERMRVVDDEDGRRAKRPRLEDPQAHLAQPIRIRRLSVIFSSVGQPVALDYVVRKDGITTLPDDTVPDSTMPPPPPPLPPPAHRPRPTQGVATIAGVSPFDIGTIAIDAFPEPSLSAEDEIGEQSAITEAEEGPQQEGSSDEWDQYWKDADAQDDWYSTTDFASSSQGF